MSIGGNIKLNINAGDSLSSVIDKKLDSDLSKDVKLNLAQWNSVFAIVKQDNATGTKQYTGGDTNITDGSHFQVKAGQVYEITQAAWKKIVAIAKGEKVETVKEEETPQVSETKEEVETKAAQKTPEETVKEILANNKVEIDKVNLPDVVDKYKAFLNYAKLNNQDINSQEVQNKINEIIVNYARSLKYVSFELDVAEGKNTENTFNIEGLTNDDMVKNNVNAVKTTFEKMGKEQVAFYDTDFDGKISFDEYKKVAIGDAEDEEIIKDVKANFDIIANGDEYIDVSEQSAYLWAMSKCLDKKGETVTSNNITVDEQFTTAQAMRYLALVNKKPEELTAEEQQFLEDNEYLNIAGNFLGLLKNGNEAF